MKRDPSRSMGHFQRKGKKTTSVTQGGKNWRQMKRDRESNRLRQQRFAEGRKVENLGESEKKKPKILTRSDKQKKRELQQIKRDQREDDPQQRRRMREKDEKKKRTKPRPSACQISNHQKYHLIELSMCPKEGKFARKDCIERDCALCGVHLLRERFSKLEDQGHSVIHWLKWV